MSYIIMGTQETGEEGRANDEEYPTRELAYQDLPEVEERLPEWRNFWVEELHDMAYWMEKIAMYNDDEWDRGDDDDVDHPRGY